MAEVARAKRNHSILQPSSDQEQEQARHGSDEHETAACCGTCPCQCQ